MEVDFERCWTGRRWVNIHHGWFAIGFGPNRFIERIMWKYKLIYPKLGKIYRHRIYWGK